MDGCSHSGALLPTRCYHATVEPIILSIWPPTFVWSRAGGLWLGCSLKYTTPSTQSTLLARCTPTGATVVHSLRRGRRSAASGRANPAHIFGTGEEVSTGVANIRPGYEAHPLFEEHCDLLIYKEDYLDKIQQLSEASPLFRGKLADPISHNNFYFFFSILQNNKYSLDFLGARLVDAYMKRKQERISEMGNVRPSIFNVTLYLMNRSPIPSLIERKREEENFDLSVVGRGRSVADDGLSEDAESLDISLGSITPMIGRFRREPHQNEGIFFSDKPWYTE